MKILVRGLGLAGTWAALECVRRGVDVTVIDTKTHVPASRVAAGLINPTTGANPKPTWRSDVLLPFSQESYATFAERTGVDVWTDRLIRRVFLTEKDAQLWDKAVKRGVGVDWKPMKEPLDGVEFPYGGAEYPGATVDTVTFLDTARRELEEQSIVTTEDQTDEDFDYVIWCQGYQAASDPMWSWLPFQPVKGEIIDATIEGPSLTSIYLRGAWIIPVGEGTVRIGATHDWDNLNSTTTEEARDQLIEKAKAILGREIVATDQQAAVRPAARSKRPYLGVHPRNDRHVIINGLGAKGTLWSPWAARRVMNHLIDNEEIDDEVNIMRWWD